MKDEVLPENEPTSTEPQLDTPDVVETGPSSSQPVELNSEGTPIPTGPGDRQC